MGKGDRREGGPGAGGGGRTHRTAAAGRDPGPPGRGGGAAPSVPPPPSRLGFSVEVTPGGGEGGCGAEGTPGLAASIFPDGV